MTKKKSYRNLAVVLVLMSLIVGYGLVTSGLIPLQVGYPSGWEMYNQLCGVRLGTGSVLSQSSDFTNPNFVSYPLWKVGFNPTGQDFGYPTMEAELGDIHHVDFTGNDIPNDQYAKELTVTRGSNTFYLDYHIYLFTITIRSIANVQVVGSTGIGPAAGNVFAHQTSWTCTWSTAIAHGAGNPPAGIGKEFNGFWFVKFVISPWSGVSYHTPPNSSYVLNTAWAGIMNAYIMPGGEVQGQVQNQYPSSDNNPSGMPNPNSDAPLSIVGGISGGNQVPMFIDDGTFGTPAPTVNWGSSVTPDTRIASTTVLAFPSQIFPGAKTYSNFWGSVMELYPCDGYVMYTVRVDILQTHEFTLETAYKPPTPQAPSDYYTWAEDWWTSFLHGLDPFAFLDGLEPFAWWLVTVGIVLLIVFVLVSIFAPWVLPRVTGAIRNTYDTLKGKKKR